MQLQPVKRGRYTVVSAKGRLDASWADYFADAFLGYIRNGEHHLLIDGQGLAFISSAGIRALARIHKELRMVQGSLCVVGAPEFVTRTLETTGFGHWLSPVFPDDMEPLEKPDTIPSIMPDELYQADPAATLQLRFYNSWQPWSVQKTGPATRLVFSENAYALGIGSPPAMQDGESWQYGEFVTIGGNLVYQPPEEKSRPDYMIPEKDYHPEIMALQAMVCEGNMSHLFRFSPAENSYSTGISALAEKALAVVAADMAGFVVLAEVEGLTGASLIRLPDDMGNADKHTLSGLRSWLSFCGEKVFPGELAMIFGVVTRSDVGKNGPLFRELPSLPGLYAHIHATVFPFQPLPNGKIDLAQQAAKLFGGPPPRALLHLVDDNRLTAGLGETKLIRGACWCAPIKKWEEIA